MLRLAFTILAVVIAGLFLVSLLPDAQRIIPDSSIKLEAASVTLYPQEDPEAIWYFASPEVSYNPDTRETTLHTLEDGERSVAGETDFTLESERVTITSDDNLRGEQMLATILYDKDDPEDDWKLAMAARNGRQILINQRSGKFEIPHVDITGDGATITEQNMFIDFALESFESGGEGTVGYSEFEIGDTDGE